MKSWQPYDWSIHWDKVFLIETEIVKSWQIWKPRRLMSPAAPWCPKVQLAMRLNVYHRLTCMYTHTSLSLGRFQTPRSLQQLARLVTPHLPVGCVFRCLTPSSTSCAVRCRQGQSPTPVWTEMTPFVSCFPMPAPPQTTSIHPFPHLHCLPQTSHIKSSEAFTCSFLHPEQCFWSVGRPKESPCWLPAPDVSQEHGTGTALGQHWCWSEVSCAPCHPALGDLEFRLSQGIGFSEAPAWAGQGDTGVSPATVLLCTHLHERQLLSF